MLFSGRGQVELAVVDGSGNIGVRYDLGCLDALDVQIATDIWEKTEKCSGQNQIIGSGEKATKVTGSGTALEWKKRVLETLVRGSLKTQSGDKAGSITNELISGTVAALDYYDTKRVGISAVTITDSAGSPAAVTDFTVSDAAKGRILFDADFNPAGLTMPLKVNYTYAEPNYVALFTSGIKSVNLRYHYKNNQNNDGPGILELYKVNINPAKNLTLLNEENADFPFDFQCLADLTRSPSGVLGQFGRIIDASLT